LPFNNEKISNDGKDPERERSGNPKASGIKNQNYENNSLPKWRGHIITFKKIDHMARNQFLQQPQFMKSRQI